MSTPKSSGHRAGRPEEHGVCMGQDWATSELCWMVPKNQERATLHTIRYPEFGSWSSTDPVRKGISSICGQRKDFKPHLDQENAKCECHRLG